MGWLWAAYMTHSYRMPLLEHMLAGIPPGFLFTDRSRNSIKEAPGENAFFWLYIGDTCAIGTDRPGSGSSSKRDRNRLNIYWRSYAFNCTRWRRARKSQVSELCSVVLLGWRSPQRSHSQHVLITHLLSQ